MNEKPTKTIALVAIMGALGNLLAFFTIAPTISSQIGLDFSNLPVLIVGLAAGPVAASATGFIAGITPSIFFGFVGGSLGFLGFSTSIGKALFGLFAGFLFRSLRPTQRKYGTLLAIPISVLSFIPEAIWIYVVFSALVFIFLPSDVASFLTTLAVPIILKGFVETTVMGFFMSALSGHVGFKSFMERYFSVKFA